MRNQVTELIVAYLLLPYLALAHPEFGNSVNPIPTGRGRLSTPHYCWPNRILKPNDISAIGDRAFNN